MARNEAGPWSLVEMGEAAQQAINVLSAYVEHEDVEMCAMAEALSMLREAREHMRGDPVLKAAPALLDVARAFVSCAPSIPEPLLSEARSAIAQAEGR